MATRYWRGGDGTWDSTNTANWGTAVSSSSGEPVPTIDDVVRIDNSSFDGNSVLNITIDDDVFCEAFRTDTLDWVGGTLNIIMNSGSITIKNQVEFYQHPDMTDITVTYNTEVPLKTTNLDFTYEVGASSGFSYIEVKEGCTFEMFPHNASIVVPHELEKLTLGEVGDTTSCYFVFPAGVNRFNELTTKQLVLDGGFANLSLSSSTVYLTGDTDSLKMESGSLLSCNTLYLQPSSLSQSYTLNAGSGISVGNVYLKPSATNTTFTFNGTGTTLNNFSIDGTASNYATSIEFQAASVFTFNDWDLDGTATGTVAIKSATPGVQASLIWGSAGVAQTNYNTVTDISGSPDYTWLSLNSTDGGNNDQWYFDVIPSPKSSLFFGSHV